MRYAVRENAEQMGCGGLVKACVPFFDAGNSTLINLASDLNFSVTGSTSPEPTGCLFNGTDVAQASDPSLLVGLNATIIANIIQRSTSLTARIFSSSNSPTSGYRGLMLYSLGTTGEVNLLLGGSLGTFASDNRRNTHISNNYVQQNKSTFIAASPTTFTGAANIWVNANKCTTTLSGTASTFSAGTTPSVIGAVNTGSWYYSDVVVENLIVIGKNLSESEVLQFYAAPYALLMPVSRPVYFDLGAGGGTSLTISNGSHSQTAVSASLAQVHALAINGAIQNQTAESLALSQVHALSVGNATHNQESLNVLLSQIHQLSIFNASSLQNSENITLNQNHIVWLQSSSHSQSSENVTLTLGEITSLIIQSAVMGLSSINASLQQVNNVVVQNANSNLTSENLTLYQIHSLLVESGLHYSDATNCIISLSTMLEIQNATSGHFATNLILSQQYLLDIQDAVCSVVSENSSLSQNHTLIVSDALHSQLTSNVLLIDESNIIPTPDERVFLISSQDRLFIIAAQERVFKIGN